MKTKIYEQNDFKKYFNKNNEFKEADLPDYIRNSISNKIIPKKSFSVKNENKIQESNDRIYFSNNFTNREKSIYTTNFSFYNTESNNLTNENSNNLYNFSNYNPTTTSNNDNNKNFQNKNNNSNCGFSKFLEKKSVYDKLTEIKESIGKRKINSPFIVLSNHQNEKSELYNKIINPSPNDYFVQSPKMLKSLISINCKETNNLPDDFFKIKKHEKSYSISKEPLNKSLYNNYDNSIKLNKDNLNNIDENRMRTNNSNLKTFNNDISFDNNNKIEEINRISLRSKNNSKEELGLIVKEPSKVNILHKIEQYKDYLRFKGV